MVLRCMVCFAFLLVGMTVWPGAAEAHFTPSSPGAGLYDSKNGCIHYETALPAVPSAADDQFVVRSTSADAGVAKMVAGVLRSQGVFDVYEKGLGIPSLLQPGQPGPFPVFVDSNLDPDLDGVFARLCEYPTRGALVVSATIKTHDELAATADHELFHAAQYALLGELTTGPNWWFEATATAAEVWFGAKSTALYDSALINNPLTPMDEFKSLSPHQYAAYLFVEWILRSSARPSSAGWTFLRDSIQDVKSLGPTDGVNAALGSQYQETFAGEVASFWADHTNPHPLFGPPAHPVLDAVNASQEIFTLQPPQQYAARLRQFRPAAEYQRLELIIHDLPAGLEVWINQGNGLYWKLQPGASFNETFCRSGSTPGSYPLPDTGDVRLAIVTTGRTAPPPLDIKTLAATIPCPKPLVIVPGFGIGPLHLGMSVQEANSAATPEGLTKPEPSPLHDGSTIQIGSFGEGDMASVFAIFRSGRLALTGISANRRFITTTGITTFEPLLYEPPNPWVVPGSTELDFEHSGKNVLCTDYRGNAKEQMCVYQEPKTRYTFASAAYEACTPDNAKQGCNWPAPDFYVNGLGVATDKGWTLYKTLAHLP